MGGGLMQLVAYGAQDIYLTGQPQITFFKAVYRRHTNFAMESIQQTVNGRTVMGQRCECTIGRNADLLLGCHVQLDAVSGPTAAQKPWSYENFCVFDHVELEIGGQKVDTIYGDWAILYAELVYRKGYSIVNSANAGDGIGSDPLGQSLNNTKGDFTTAALSGARGGSIYIPLLFYFNNNPGLAIPLIALQYHEVKFILHIATAGLIDTNTGVTSAGQVVQVQNSLGEASGGAGTGAVATSIANMRFYADYAYLDTTERRKFAQNAHEYLITQHQRIQTNATTNTNQNFNLSTLNHPVKYVAWRLHVAGDNTFLACNTYTSAKITLNGNDRFSSRLSSYFEDMQVHQFWPCGGNQLTYASNGATLDANAGKWSVYSFALRPAEHQPSGTCNFSRIDNSRLEIVGPQGSTDRFTLHAENYNVLRIMSGMGGLAYSN